MWLHAVDNEGQHHIFDKVKSNIPVGFGWTQVSCMPLQSESEGFKKLWSHFFLATSEISFSSLKKTVLLNKNSLFNAYFNGYSYWWKGI